MSSKLLGLLVLSGMLMTLSACYESPDVTVYKPGVYKGTRDPLLEKLQSPEMKQQLRERFAQVQPDR
ncbi:MAG: hypothetical protein ACE5LB_17650 [Acidiferrobacterales bacterium]